MACTTGAYLGLYKTTPICRYGGDNMITIIAGNKKYIHVQYNKRFGGIKIASVIAGKRTQFGQ